MIQPRLTPQHRQAMDATSASEMGGSTPYLILKHGGPESPQAQATWANAATLQTKLALVGPQPGIQEQTPGRPAGPPLKFSQRARKTLP